MPRTRNVTRQQWDAAVSADPSASAIRSAGSTSSHHHRTISRSSMTCAHTEDGRTRESSLSIGSSKENYFGYEEADEENITPPLIRGKGKGKEVAKGERRGRMGRKRPLQDITAAVVTRPNLASDSDDIPRRRRRRVRQILDATPVSPLSPSPTKRREPLARHIRFPSSLPPSSPPPPLSLSLASDDADRSPSSDPFGFFTVERELKSKRTREPAALVAEAKEAGGLILVPATSPLRLDLSAARVLRSSMRGKEKQKEETTSGSKRKIRRKARDEDGNKTPSDPIELAQRLINRLPKRRKKVKEEAGNKGSKSGEKQNTRPTRKPVSKKQKSKAPVTVKPDKERLARRDYFKQLDKYSLEEEKVYVI